MSSFLLTKYRNELKSFKKHLDKTRARQTSGNIHKLRVSIKKLRVMNAVVLPLLERPKHIKMLYLFDKLFKSAGRVRETQINIKLVTAIDKNYLKPYLGTQKSSLKSAGKVLKRELMDFDLNELSKLEKAVQQALSKSSDQEQLQHATNCLVRSLNKINALLLSPHNDRSLHSIRKNVRRCTEILKLTSDAEVTFKTKKLLSGMRAIQQHIGTWHDQAMLFQSINEFMQFHEPAVRWVNLRKFNSKTQLEANKSRDEIYDELKCELPNLIKQSNLKI
jgi:CHAD domain-containing protein